jgi:3-oxoacyl-[acyl-carrier protein] reductase
MVDSNTNKPVMLITGTSKGIGEYLANYYLNKGFIVLGCSRTTCRIENDNYFHFIADIGNEDEILNIFKTIRKVYKRLDVLINNAAINPAILNVAFLPYETIQKIFKINVFAPIMFCREAIKLMSRNKFGRIINIGSMATRHKVAGEALYTATKSSINAFTKVLAKEIINSRITVNVLAPSAIETDLSKAINQEALMSVLNRNAIKNYGELVDISNSIDYLIKEESKSVTGQVIYLGGV